MSVWRLLRAQGLINIYSAPDRGRKSSDRHLFSHRPVGESHLIRQGQKPFEQLIVNHPLSALPPT